MQYVMASVTVYAISCCVNCIYVLPEWIYVGHGGNLWLLEQQRKRQQQRQKVFEICFDFPDGALADEKSDLIYFLHEQQHFFHMFSAELFPFYYLGFQRNPMSLTSLLISHCYHISISWIGVDISCHLSHHLTRLLFNTASIF